MKTCSTCGAEKDFCDFQKRSASLDGLTASCRECLSARDRARYQKERGSRAERHKAYMATGRGKEAHARAAAKWREENMVKRAAHVILGHAIRSGKVVRQPCSMCWEPVAEAHHEDYDKPLDVVWLCSACHKARHKEMKVE